MLNYYYFEKLSNLKTKIINSLVGLAFITKLRLHIMLIALIISLLFIAFLSYLTRDFAVEGLKKRGMMLVQCLAHDLAHPCDLGVIIPGQKFVQEPAQKKYAQSDVAYTLIYDSSKNILLEKKKHPYKESLPVDDFKNLPPHEGTIKQFKLGIKDVYDFVFPITTLELPGIDSDTLIVKTGPIQSLELTKNIHSEYEVGSPQRIIGYARLGLYTDSIQAQINKVIQLILLVTALFLFIAILTSNFLANILIRPILDLTNGVKAIEEGNLKHRIRLQTEDEFADLARSFNKMALSLEKNIEKLKRSNIDLEQFAQIASHDLREPLRMIGGYTQLFARRYKGKLDSDADKFIGYTIEGVAQMQTLIDDLLTYSKLSTHGKKFAHINCNEVCRKSLINLQAAIENSGANIICEPLPTVRGDGTQLMELCQNLIGNAIKFCDDKNPIVKVAAKRQGSKWLFSVIDNGIGIDPLFFDRIFETFQRLHSREEYAGTGIGLAVCKKIVERHGGHIWVESEPEKGSAFYFTLPIDKAYPHLPNKSKKL
ncbi:MAG: ATP-binding protein [Candidatus Margulisiibacteriota bacterium]